ncbi:hypothetical protein V3C99_006521 [Haemonchus contortus]|uniref:Uncharacterized protein n=1 Tax=Haemonchus contortus TaxID=6289 RepID=A0A7I4XSN6_HAECO
MTQHASVSRAVDIYCPLVDNQYDRPPSADLTTTQSSRLTFCTFTPQNTTFSAISHREIFIRWTDEIRPWGVVILFLWSPFDSTCIHRRPTLLRAVSVWWSGMVKEQRNHVSQVRRDSTQPSAKSETLEKSNSVEKAEK